MQQVLSSKLTALLAKTDLQLNQHQQQQLISYVLLMHKWNKAYNLTSVREPQQMLISHIVDSLVVSPYLIGERFIDVGTGSGLPGIPLAIANPNKHFVLLDSLGKRVRFMKQVAHELQLTNIQPMQARVEDFQPAQAFDAVLSRAFASLKDMLHWCQHLVDSQGLFLALKGQYPQQEIAELPSEFQLQQSIQLHVPELTGERHLLLIRHHG